MFTFLSLFEIKYNNFWTYLLIQLPISIATKQKWELILAEGLEVDSNEQEQKNLNCN